jgi:hypothetical protein
MYEKKKELHMDVSIVTGVRTEWKIDFSSDIAHVNVV